jgi:RHS repeat-associated protein
MTTNTGVVCYDADFYPYGGERSYTNTCPQNYKFEGKEHDSETGNDDFDARYYSNRFGRWLSADWSAIPAPVPYANFTNPQTLNLYAMVADDPESFADLDGHCCDVEDVLDAVDFVAGFINTAASNNGLAIRQDARGDQTFANGQTAGDVVTTIQGGLEVLAGAGGEVGGVTLDATGVGAVLGVPANIVSAGVIAHGGAVAVNSAGHLVQDAMNAPVEKRQGDFKPSEREQAIKDNAQASGGTNKCEKCGQEVVRTQNKPGQTPPKNQLHVHHDPAIRHGGGRHSKKRIFCRECHQEEHKQ